MIKENTYAVRPKDERPARQDGTCFYCGQPIGGHHADDCVIPQKTCVVDFTIRLVTSEPAYWNKDNIEFHYNESSWCADNLMGYLEEFENNTGRCMCGLVSAEFIREATKEDEIWFGYDPSSDR